jgi:hypothetical protein
MAKSTMTDEVPDKGGVTVRVAGGGSTPGGKGERSSAPKVTFDGWLSGVALPPPIATNPKSMDAAVCRVNTFVGGLPT